MKRCPTCNQTFDDDGLSFCLNDGTGLVSATPSAPTDELMATMMATPSSLGGSSYPPPPPSQSGPGSGSFNAPPQSGPGSGSFNPPPSNPSWTPPAAQQRSAPPKSGGINKKLLFGGLGCVGLAVIVGVVAIVLLIAFSGPSSKMSPYKGDMKALVPETVGDFKRVDVDPLGERDKKDLGKVTDGIGVAYKGTSDDEIRMLVCNYSSAKEAEEGLKSFTDEGVRSGWTRSEVEKKKLGWSTVGIRYVMTKTFSTGKVDEKLLPGGAGLVRVVQSSGPTESRDRQFVSWTNGSVVYLVGASANKATEFEKVFDKEVKDVK